MRCSYLFIFGGFYPLICFSLQTCAFVSQKYITCDPYYIWLLYFKSTRLKIIGAIIMWRKLLNSSSFEKYDVEFVKKPDDGSMKGLAFIKDPDGYWIEILSAKGITDIIQSQKLFLFLPIWFLVIWPTFCCLLLDAFSFLRNRKYLSLLVGSLIGPISYYLGVYLGLASISSYMVFFIISFFWAFLLFFYSMTIRV